MVENVECVHTELERVRLFYRERLLQRDVPVLLVRSTKRIAWSGAEAGCSRVGSPVDCGQSRNERGRAEASRIERVAKPVLRGSVCVCIRNTEPRRTGLTTI